MRPHPFICEPDKRRDGGDCFIRFRQEHRSCGVGDLVSCGAKLVQTLEQHPVVTQDPLDLL